MLQALLRQRIPQDRVVAADLLQTLAHLAHALKREVGVYVDRHGTVREVVVSRRWQELLPTLSARASATRLIGLRYIAARPEAESVPAEGDRRHVIEARLDLALIIGSRKGTPTNGWLIMLAPAANGADPQTATEGPYAPDVLVHLEAAPRIKAVEGALRRSPMVITAGGGPGGGGIGTGGGGEKKLEAARRRIRQRITDLRRELDEVTRRRTLQRAARRRTGHPVVAITGYTHENGRASGGGRGE